MIVFDILSWVCISIGGLIVLIGGIGILRLPDFYTRLHGASLTDTLGAWMIILGLMFQLMFDIGTIKLIMIAILLAITSPTATHALAQAALHKGVTPRTAETKDQATK